MGVLLTVFISLNTVCCNFRTVITIILLQLTSGPFQGALHCRLSFFEATSFLLMKHSDEQDRLDL